ncbi:MAG: hypothetical protein NTX63_01185 [Candidatus Peregrinibacteria bacterium]|nr:hypothetical protein [Candidatus Peregrinibacteria bacterium]
MKNTRTHIIRTLALSLLVVVTLASFTNVFAASTVHAQDAAAPTPTADAAAAAKADAAQAEAQKTLDAAKTAAQAEYDKAIAAPGADDAAKAAAQQKLDAANNSAQQEYNAAVGASTNSASASAAPLTTLGGQTVGEVLPNNDIIVMLSKVLAIVLSMISHLLWPLLMFAGGLMKSDFLYTGAIDLKLSEMWIQVRNLVNIAYVLLLLAVALYNVVGLGETVSMLELKKALPKIILGLILVNFSYAGVKVVLDVINVGTTFAFSIGRTDAALTQATLLKVNAAQGPICDTLGSGQLAQGIGTEAKDKAIATQCSAITKAADKAKCIKGVEAVYAPKAGSAADSKAMCVPDKDGNLMMNPQVKKYLNSWNIDSSLMIIAIKFMNIQDLPKVSAAAAKGGLSSLTINMLFSVVMFLIYAVSFIVLIVILFARAAVLWMIIIFSPAIVFNATFTIPGAGGHTSKIIKTLISPMLIGFVLSIGFILLATMQNINYNGQGALASNAPTSSIDTFQDLLVAIGSIVFLWIGIQAASSDTIADGVTKTIMDSAQSAGTWLAKAPFKYAPLFQVATPHAGHHELQDMGKIGVGLDQAKYAMETMLSNADATRRSDALKAFGVNVEVSMKMKDVKSIDQLTLALKSHPDIESLRHNPKADSEEFKELEGAVKRIKNTSPDLVRVGAAGYNKDFKEFSEAVERKDMPQVEKLLPKFMPSDQPAAATPVKQTPAEVSADMKKPGSVVAVVVGELKGGSTPDPDKTAAAIDEFNRKLKDGGMASAADRGKEIAKHFVAEGVADKAKRTAAMNAALAHIRGQAAGDKIMPDADAAALVAAINAAP